MEKLITIENAHFSYPAAEENEKLAEVLKGISLEFVFSGSMRFCG